MKHHKKTWHCKDTHTGRTNALNQITVRGWQPGQLGVTLDDTVVVPVTTATYAGDVKKYVDGQGWYFHCDCEGFNHAQHGNDILDGGAGNDELTGQGGDDELYGGIGDDKLWGDSGSRATVGEGCIFTHGYRLCNATNDVFRRAA